MFFCAQKNFVFLRFNKMKCEICNSKIEETFLKKIIGSYFKDSSGKKHLICFSCQKKFLTKDKILKELK